MTYNYWHGDACGLPTPKKETTFMATKGQGGDPAYNKAGENEPIFTLRAQDKLAPEIVREWAHVARKNGVNADKVVEAMNIADQMEEWQLANATKIPD